MSDDTVSFGPAAEHLESSGGTRLRGGGRRSRRTVVTVVGGLGVVAAGGAALWAWQAYFAQGPQPSEALPSSTLAYVSIDLDPPGQQKLEALGFLRKFPAAEKELGLDTDDDVRRSIFEEFASGESCDSLKYADDIEPWIGERAALAVVQQTRLEPVVVLQVKDADALGRGLDALLECASDGGGELGYVVDGDWAVLARSESVARRVVDDADKNTLADDQEFQEMTGEAGEPGIITLYAAADAGPALLQEIDDHPNSYYFLPMFTSAFNPMSSLLSAGLMPLAYGSPDFEAEYAESGVEEYSPPELTKAEEKLLDEGWQRFEKMSEAERTSFLKTEQKIMERHYGGEFSEEEPFVDEYSEEDFPQPEVPGELRQALEEFSGLGGVVRFNDGGVELELVSDRLEGTFGNLFDGEAGDDLVSSLPDDTAFAFGAGFADGWADDAIAQLFPAYQFTGQSPAEMLADFEKATGLDVPGDVESLGGDNVALAAGEGFDPFTYLGSPEGLPVAARITGDPDRIEAVLTKIRAALPAADAKLLLSRRVDDDVLVSANAGYLAELATPGSLGDSQRFRAVVPNPDEATSVFFVNFDAGDWFVKMMSSDEERANATPLESLGFTVWADGDSERTLARLTVED
jgi:hypothetical protein